MTQTIVSPPHTTPTYGPNPTRGVVAAISIIVQLVGWLFAFVFWIVGQVEFTGCFIGCGDRNVLAGVGWFAAASLLATVGGFLAALLLKSRGWLIASAATSSSLFALSLMLATTA